MAQNWLELEVSGDSASKLKPKPRVLYIIPKRIVQKATARNKIRRWIKEAIRTSGICLDVKKIYRFKLKAKPKELNFKIIREQVNCLIKLIGL